MAYGPVGSGKSSACAVELLRRAMSQARGVGGLRRSRFVIIRNTYGQLRDTTRKTVEQWLPARLGKWREQEFSFYMRFNDVQSEILFRALDRPEDVKKLLSLELTGAYINELREVPKHVFDVLQTRVGRYPSKLQGGPSWFGIWADTNPWHSGHWGAKLFSQNLEGYEIYRQPGGRSEKAENTENLPPNYYERLVAGKDKEWVRVYVDGEDAAGDIGSVWGSWVTTLEQGGAICDFDHPNDGVFTSWDLGKADSTGIWFWRVNGAGKWDVIDHYEASGQGLGHYFGVVESKPYKYLKHLLPHDARQTTLATQQSVLDQCLERFGRSMVALTPNLDIADGIAAARWVMEQPIRIHERCAKPSSMPYSGVEALRGYRFKWDENLQTFSKDPVHDWASHSADAFRYFAVMARQGDLRTRPDAPPKPEQLARPPGSFTWDEMMDATQSSSGTRNRV